MSAIKDDPELLALMLADELRQADVYRPGPYWRPYQRRIVEAIRKHGIGAFRSQPSIGKGWSDVVQRHPVELWAEQGPVRARLKQALAQLPLIRGMLSDFTNIVDIHQRRSMRFQSAYYELRFGKWLREELARAPMPESTAGGNQDRVLVDGQEIAPRYVDALMRIHNFGRYVDFSRIRTAMEIGGGFGANAHLMLSRFPIKKLAYLDIPPMIYVATQYLRSFVGGEVQDYRATREQPSLSFADNDAREILCICPWQIERLRGSVDLLWNSASFSEMSPEIVRNYGRHAVRLLSPTGAICLLMNKTQDKAGVTLPDAVMGAFEGFRFERFEPALEHESHSIYAVGFRSGLR